MDHLGSRYCDGSQNGEEFGKGGHRKQLVLCSGCAGQGFLCRAAFPPILFPCRGSGKHQHRHEQSIRPSTCKGGLLQSPWKPRGHLLPRRKWLGTSILLERLMPADACPRGFADRRAPHRSSRVHRFSNPRGMSKVYLPFFYTCNRMGVPRVRSAPVSELCASAHKHASFLP